MLYYRGDKFVKGKKFTINESIYKFVKKSRDNKLIFESIEDKSLLTETKDKYDIIYCEEPGIKNTIYKTPRVIDNYHNLSSPLLVGEIGALNILKNVDTDYSLNVTNSYTLALLHSLSANKVTLSCELLPGQVKNLLKIKNLLI